MSPLSTALSISQKREGEIWSDEFKILSIEEDTNWQKDLSDSNIEFNLHMLPVGLEQSILTDTMSNMHIPLNQTKSVIQKHSEIIQTDYTPAAAIVFIWGS